MIGQARAIAKTSITRVSADVAGISHNSLKLNRLVAIGLVGFEPTASWSRTRRSTKLSHSPKLNRPSGVRGRRATYFAYFSADGKEIESVSGLRQLK
jgi:hypothetical protein